IFESHATTIAISYLIRVTVAKTGGNAGDGGSRPARNNFATKQWDFAATIRLSGVFSALVPPRLFAQTTIGSARSRASIAISAAIVIVAAAVLYHLLRGIEIGKVIAALEARSPWRIIIAGALAIAGYSNLVCYDLFALHTIGKRNIPLRVVA